MVSRRVMIIGDDAAFQELMTTTLTEAGYTVLHEADGHHALKWLAWFRPDLIFLDLETPDVDRWTFLFTNYWIFGSQAPIFTVTAANVMPMPANMRLRDSFPRPTSRSEVYNLLHLLQLHSDQDIPRT
jgi:CheY-like chemotaxis protein